MSDSSSTEEREGVRKLGENALPLALVAAGWAGLILALSLLSPGLPALSLVVAYVVAFGTIIVMTLVAASVAPVVGWRSLALYAPLALATLGALVYVGEDVPQPLAASLVTFVLLFFGAMIGAAVGGRIEHAGHLLVVVVVSLMVDSFSVFHSAGPTAAVVERPALIAVLALPFPVFGTSMIAPVLGVGDVVFAGLYMAASRRFSLGARRTAIAIASGLVATLIAVTLIELPLPALVGMGVAVLIAHPRAWHLPKKDRKRALIGMALLVSLWLVLFLRDH